METHGAETPGAETTGVESPVAETWRSHAFSYLYPAPCNTSLIYVVIQQQRSKSTSRFGSSSSRLLATYNSCRMYKDFIADVFFFEILSPGGATKIESPSLESMVCRRWVWILIRSYIQYYWTVNDNPNSPTLKKNVSIIISSKQIVKLEFIFVS